jgi:hypothetical protein
MVESPEKINVLQSLWRKFIGLFKRRPAGENTVIDEAESKKRKFTAELKKISRTGSAVEIKSSFLLHFEVIGVMFENRGRSDGRLEINPSLAADIIKSEAKELQGLIKGVFTSKVIIDDTTKTDRENSFNIAKGDLDTQKEYVGAIEKKYRFDYKDFAVFIGILYILFSIGFLIADVPLSRLVVQQGFEIKSNIDAWLLTIGITLVGVYFKIWWDEYVNPGVEKIVTKNRKKNLEGFETIPEKDLEQGIKTVKRARYGRGLLKAAILLTALFSIGILGYFRYIVYIYTEFTLQSKPIPDALASFSAVSGFILISILFPFLGGICLSIGTDKVQNWKERRSAKRQLRNREKEYLIALKAKEDAQKELNASVECLEWSKDKTFVEDRKDLFTSRYNSGYNIGLTQINLEMDILTKAENVRKRMLGRNTYIKTQPIIDESYFQKVGQNN